MEYSEVLDILFKNSDEKRAIFNYKIIRSKYKNLGVPSNVTLDLSKKLAKEAQNVQYWPYYEYHEINLIIGISTVLRKDLSIEDKFRFIEGYFKNVDNWAVVDSTAAKFKIKAKDFEIAKKYYDKMINSPFEYVRRFVFVSILDNFTNKDNFEVVYNYFRNDDKYYVQMAESWLISNYAIKGLKDEAISLLTKPGLDKAIINKAISKICDSFRVTNEDKNFYRQYRIK